MELHGCDVDHWGEDLGGEEGEEGGEVVGVGDEDGVGVAVQAGEEVCAEVLEGVFRE